MFLQLLEFAVEEYMIEVVVFWLDVEQFKHFDGNQDDLALYAQHISMVQQIIFFVFNITQV